MMDSSAPKRGFVFIDLVNFLCYIVGRTYILQTNRRNVMNKKSGEFLPVIPSNTFPDLERDDRYPGFRWISSSSSEDSWVSIDSSNEHVLEVKGKMYRSELNGEAVLKQDVVVVLRGKEVDLYESLQWLDAFRGHPSIGLGAAIVAFSTLTLLSLFQGVALSFVWSPFESVWLNVPTAFATAFFLSFLEILTYDYLAYEYIKKRAKYTSLEIVRKLVDERPENGKEYVRQLLTNLTKANCSDRANVANQLLRLL